MSVLTLLGLVNVSLSAGHKSKLGLAYIAKHLFSPLCVVPKTITVI